MPRTWRPWRTALLTLTIVPALVALTGVLLPGSARAQGDPAAIWKHTWPRTDFSKFSIELDEIISGGPPKDGIPPIDKPAFVTPAEADAWLAPDEPVLVYEHNGDARAYPLQILIWHEIVNDAVGGRPVVVTFCPLCNSALVFDRRVKGQVLDFGTTGKLRRSDLVMWDRQTESWWQQLTGEAIVGAFTGTQLTYLPSPLVAYRSFRESFPQGRVLSRETGYFRNYGANPYLGYDSPANTQPFLFSGEVDARLPAMERVVVVELDGQAKAYPYRELAKTGAVNDRVAGRDIVVLFQQGTRSALDAGLIARSRDVGAGVVLERTVQGRVLTFAVKDGALLDNETGTRWDQLGQATAGPLKGARLPAVVHGNHFAFAWLSFRPNSQIYKAP